MNDMPAGSNSVEAAPGHTCAAPWDGAVVHLSGAVFPCTMLCHRSCGASLLLGNLRTEPLEAILTGPRARALRRRLARGDLEGLCCAHCDRAFTCNLYGDPVTARPVAEPNWTKKGPERNPATTPFRLELALTDRCNLRCRMCALTRDEGTPPGVSGNGFMPLNVVEAAVRGAVTLAGKASVQVWLHWLGEPLLHPEIHRVLQCLAEAGETVRIFLVTNGVRLSEETARTLLELPCPVTLSVSLNAWTRSTYRKIHGTDRLDHVVRQTRAYLNARTSASGRYPRPVIVTLVVLKENLLEAPAFVHGWETWFQEAGGTPSFSLNGRPASTDEQVMLLCEVDDPASPALFREAVRRSGIRQTLVDLNASRPLDRLVTWSVSMPHDSPPDIRIDPALLLQLTSPDGPILPRELPAVLRALLAAGRHDLAHRLLEQCINDVKRPLPQMVTVALDQGDHLFVRTLLEKHRQILQDRAWYWATLGRAWLASGRPKLARDAFMESLRRATADDTHLRLDVHQRLAHLHLHRNDWKAALDETRAALEHAEVPTEHLERLAGALRTILEGTPAQARAAQALLPHIVDTSSWEPERVALRTQWLRGRTLLARGELTEARTILERCLAHLFPWHPELELGVRHALVDLYLAMENAEEALQHARKAVSLAPEDAYSRRLEAEAEAESCYRQGRVEEARRTIGRFLDNEEFDPDQRVQTLFRVHLHGDITGAMDLATRFLQTRPGDPFALWIRGANRLRIGDLEQAESDLEQSLALARARQAPFLDAVLDSLAELALNQDEPARAILYAREALAIRPERQQTARLLARAQTLTASTRHGAPETTTDHSHQTE